MKLVKAQKKKVKLKLGMSGASGFGKTYGALKLAKGICGDWSKIALIDTENGSGSLYSDLGEYNTIDLKAPYSPERYIEAIKTCEEAGIEVIICDSITHEWDGEGGCLEINEQLGGRFTDWAKTMPRHKKFINAILQTNCHFITTVRRKQDYEIVKEGSRTKVQKVGTKEITKEGFEYELTVNFEITNDKHLVNASKDRTGLFMNKPEFVVTEETGKLLIDWANSGVDEKKYLLESINGAKNREEAITIFNNNPIFKADEDVIKALQQDKFKEVKGFKKES
tara:strand:+ start:92 stop:934 length:843 start_codon:yes stop_codon:yes gene_type:complete